jgi:hypothetical protein
MAPISVTLRFRLPTGRCFNKPTFCPELFFLTTDKPRSLGGRSYELICVVPGSLHRQDFQGGETC